MLFPIIAANLFWCRNKLIDRTMTWKQRANAKKFKNGEALLPQPSLQASNNSFIFQFWFFPGANKTITYCEVPNWTPSIQKTCHFESCLAAATSWTGITGNHKKTTSSTTQGCRSASVDAGIANPGRAWTRSFRPHSAVRASAYRARHSAFNICTDWGTHCICTFKNKLNSFAADRRGLTTLCW